MEQVNITIIGAGVIGLSIAYRLSSLYRDVIVVEKEESFGRHTSSRNSEVIHSGIYYVPGSLKASLSVEGNRMLYPFLEQEQIPYRNCGKFVIATQESEVEKIEAIYRNGMTNGVTGLELVDGAYIEEQEPPVKALMGLYVPSTGIMDVHALMRRLAHHSEQQGALISYATEVTEITPQGGGYQLTFSDGYELQSRIVINAGGIFCDRVAALVGIDVDACNYRIRYCKGEYFKTTRYRNMNRLVYPVPDPDGKSLGIHTRLHLDGTVAFGPNAYFVDELDYSVDEGNKEHIHRSVSRFLPIAYEDITPDDAGIRPQLPPLTDKPRDFIIVNEREKGLDGFINLIGIESPGLTSCLAIADYLTENVLPSV